MILVEVALQNAKSFPPKVRIGFKPGLNVVRFESPEAHVALIDCIYFPLFPDPSRSSATEHLVATEQGRARAALSFYGRDKKAYRVLRDLGTGATRLYRFDGESKKYELLTEVTTEAAQYVRVQQQLPDEVSFERLFVVSADGRPSLGGRARSRSGTPVIHDFYGSGSFPSVSGAGYGFGGTGDFDAPPRGGSVPGWGPGAGTPPLGVQGPGGTFGSSMNLTNALVQSEIEGGPVEPEAVRRDDVARELQNLERHLEAAKEADAAQGELDGLQRRRADLVQRADVLVQARAQAEDLERDLAEQGSDLADASPKLRERLHGFEAAEARYRNDISRLEQEQKALGYASETTDILVLERDPYFLGGIAVAFLALVLAFATNMAWVALFNLVGAAVAAASAFRYVGELEGHQRLEGRIRHSDERRARIDKQYELETALVRRTMEQLGIDDHRELLQRLDARLQLQHRVDEALEAVRRAEADPSIAGAARELDEVNARIATLEPKVLGSAGTLQSPEQMERRIRTLRAELDRMDRSTGNVPIVEGTADVAGPRSLTDDFEDTDDGYVSGYGSGSGSGRGGAGPGFFGVSSGSQGEGLSAASGMGPGGGYGGFGGVSNYGGLGGPGGGDGSGLPPDRSRDLMQAGADLVQMDIEGLIGALKPRLVQYLAALSDQRVPDCSFGPRGELTVHMADGRERPYMQLGGEGLDLVDLALRFSLVEAITARTKIPLIVEDWAREFPERRRKLFLQMLQHLSKLTQVIVCTDQADVPGHQVGLDASE